MIILHNLTLSFGDQKVFNKINATFRAGQKIGIVGRNGAGKSTLLKTIVGDQQIDEGTISIERDKKIAYMPQEVILNSHKTVFDEAFSIFEHFTNKQKECAEIEKKLETGPNNAEQLLERYINLQEQLSHFDYPTALARTNEILYGLGFNDDRISQTVDTLSVGWKMRLVLVKLLLTNADFYFFDEPTNHLDLVTKEWFFEFLNRSNFGFLLVSHDRYFLDNACENILELERGNGTMYDGNFSKYVRLKEEQQAAQLTAYNAQQKEISRKKDTIERFRASASKAKMAQSMIKQLNKIELIEIEPPLPHINFTFRDITRPGKVVLTVKNVAHKFDDELLFKNASFEIMRGQKVALIAPNGTGKTTLFNLIVENYPLQQGSIEFGHNVITAFFQQDQTKALDGNKTIFDEVASGCSDANETSIRRFLGSFLFTGSDANKKISVLSGGEKNRVAMVKVLLQNANFLILDEPTNHLDLYAKEILLQALKQFKGTILLVSHDHAFIQQLADHILELTTAGIESYPCDYETYLVMKKNREEPLAHRPEKSHTITPENKPVKKQNNLSNKQAYTLRKEANKLEKKVGKLENERSCINLELTKLAYGTPEFITLDEKLQTLAKQIVQVTQDWENILVQLS